MNLIHQQAKGKPLTLAQWIFPGAGAFLDPPHRLGLSRLTLRLMLMGAGGLSNEEFNGKLERLGASAEFGLVNDHFTLRLMALTPQLDPALELIALALREPNFDEAEFERLREEMVSGWRAEREESKQLRAQEVFLRRSYGEGPQSHLADGLADGLRECTLEDVREQYRRLFTGGDPILAVLSDLSREKVRERFPEFPKSPGNADSPPGQPWDGFSPPEPGGRLVTLVPDLGTNTDEVILGAFSTHQNDPEWHVHRVIAWIFGGDMNSRLFREVRGERGYSYGASCWYEAATGRFPRNRPAPFVLYTFPSIEYSAEAVPLVVSLYEQLVSEGVTGDELRLAKKALVNSHPFKRDTPEKKLELEVARRLYGIVTDEEEAFREKLDRVTPADVLRTLRETHHPERMRIVLLGDPARLEPIANAIQGVDSVETFRYP